MYGRASICVLQCIRQKRYVLLNLLCRQWAVFDYKFFFTYVQLEIFIRKILLLTKTGATCNKKNSNNANFDHRMLVSFK